MTSRRQVAGLEPGYQDTIERVIRRAGEIKIPDFVLTALIRRTYVNLTEKELTNFRAWLQINRPEQVVLEINFSLERPWHDLYRQIFGRESEDDQRTVRRQVHDEIIRRGHIILFILNPEQARTGIELSTLRSLNSEGMGKEIMLVTTINNPRALADATAEVSPFSNVFPSSPAMTQRHLHSFGAKWQNPYERSVAT